MNSLTFDISFILLLTTILVNIFLAILVFSKAPHKRQHQLFTVFILSLSIWLFAYYFEDEPLGYDIQLLFIRLDWILAPLTALLFLLFLSYFPKAPPRMFIRVIPVMFIVTIIMSILGGFTKLMMSQFTVLSEGITYKSGPYDLLYAMYIIFLIISGLLILFYQFQTTEGTKKLQTFYIGLGVLIPSLLIITINLLYERSINYEFRTLESEFLRTVRRFGAMSTITFTIASTYAILRHRLFGIRVILGEVLFWICTALFLFVTFYLVAVTELNIFGTLTSIPVIIINIIIAIIVAVLFNLFGRQLRKFIRHNIINYAYNPDLIIEDFIVKASTATQTEEVTHHLMDISNKIFSTEFQVLLAAKDESYFELTVHEMGVLGVQKELLNQPDTITTLFEHTDNKETILFDQRMKQQPHDPLTQLMKDLGIEVIIPIQHDAMYGLWLLGHRLGQKAYTHEDLQLLEKLAFYAGLNLVRTL